MSIVALQVREDYALIAGDGVCTDPETGAVAGYMSKITAMPDLDCAIAITGVGGFNHALQWNMPCWVKDFDGFIEALPDLARLTHEKLCRDNMIRGDDNRANLMAAGWSIEEQRYKAVRVVSYEKGTTNSETGDTAVLAPFVAHEFTSGGMWMSSAPKENNMKLFGLTEAIDGESDVDSITRAICAGRASSGMVLDGERSYHYNAGGYVQIALIQRGHINTWITHRWPEDIIGFPVRPEFGSPLPPHLKLISSE
ncbi:hypothetical protein [uncultured Pseudosulfitobacter sp.]|uniref:hypothetical protein n=1 Tax=uncultured Pseudosulfitobacter sp. TaxID=2854214 RepID=UPI0030DA85A1|tara:strand:- start:2968 stop:3729 length:762 start_codon:yes stop_codon:yes gene_type:complete